MTANKPSNDKPNVTNNDASRDAGDIYSDESDAQTQPGNYPDAHRPFVTLLGKQGLIEQRFRIDVVLPDSPRGPGRFLRERIVETEVTEVPLEIGKLPVSHFASVIGKFKRIIDRRRRNAALANQRSPQKDDNIESVASDDDDDDDILYPQD